MSTEFVVLVEPSRSRTPGSGTRRFALWQLGFRPFYLLASVQAALSVGLWALQSGGALPVAYLSGAAWHAHEMLFGFALAVIVGFLFTAGKNWCGRPTPHGAWLAALAGLWLAARVLVLTPFGVAAAVANVAFPLAAALGLALAFVRARHRRNAFFVLLLVGLAAAALAFHLAQLRVIAWPRAWGLPVGLDLVLFAMAVMGGRVIPMFTNNGVPGAGAVRKPWVERAALGSVLLVLALDALAIDGAPVAIACAIGALLHALRLALWRPWRTLRSPLVWVLHAGYAWIVPHLALRAGAELGAVGTSIAWHALTAGAIGTLTLGMMTRTALGHTGRPLRAGRAEVATYALVVAAGLLRVLWPLLMPAQALAAIVASGACWSAAFGLYAVVYAPRLVRARVDGRPG